MADVFIFHGSYGYPEENWFPWLKSEIKKLGHNTYVPKLPTPENQNLSSWLKVFEQYISKLNSETILVGHSCGAIFILRILERINVKIKAVFLVAGPVKPLNNEFDKVHMSFVDHPINWDVVKEHSTHFFPIYSATDPYVAMEHGEITSKELGVDLIKVENAGHFNTKAGYNKFELLLDLIKNEL